MSVFHVNCIGLCTIYSNMSAFCLPHNSSWMEGTKVQCSELCRRTDSSQWKEWSSITSFPFLVQPGREAVWLTALWFGSLPISCRPQWSRLSPPLRGLPTNLFSLFLKLNPCVYLSVSSFIVNLTLKIVLLFLLELLIISLDALVSRLHVPSDLSTPIFPPQILLLLLFLHCDLWFL